LEKIESVLEKLKKHEVEFIKLQFTDTLGNFRSLDVPVEQFKKNMENGFSFDGSSIPDFAPIENSDMVLLPDYNTFKIFPWLSEINGTGAIAGIICDILTAEKEEFTGSPRSILKRTIKEAESLGYKMMVGPEIEFFLFQVDEHGQPTVNLTDKGGYFSEIPDDKAFITKYEISSTLTEMGIEVEAIHHEVAASQHEIDFKFDNALATADNVMMFKYIVKNLAYEQGLHACFMPKPIFGINGSGMHTHQSLFNKENENLFYDSCKGGISQLALYYIGGLLHHIREITLILNPIVNSYKRLIPGYEAPVNIGWAFKNRSPLIRVPEGGKNLRIELRSPDPACNPYLAFALMLKAGLKGIEEKIEPPQPISENVYRFTEQEKNKLNIKSLPRDLYEALAEFKNSTLAKETLGEKTFEFYISLKQKEWQNYSTLITDFELNNYLNV